MTVLYKLISIDNECSLTCRAMIIQKKQRHFPKPHSAIWNMEPVLKIEEVKICESWKITNQRGLDAAVQLVESADNYDIEDTVSADTCVLLQMAQQLVESPSLFITITPPTQYVITGLSLLSEARNLEIHNHKSEYVTTVRSMLVDNVDEDFVVYRSDIKFHQPLTECKIKFLSLRSQNEMWFYGAAVVVSKQSTPTKHSLGPSLYLDHLVTELEKDGHHLSDNAKSFANLLQTFSSSNLPASLPVFKSLLSCKNSWRPWLESESGTNTQTQGPGIQQECQKIVGQCTDSDVTPNQDQGTIVDDNSTTSRDSASISDMSLLVSALKPLLTELEDRLWSRMKVQLEEQEQRQMEKLNHIVKLLEQK